MIFQGFKKEVDNEFERAEVYYAILSVINNFKLAKREIELVAFTAVKGNISNANVRSEFCKMYETTDSTIGNIVSKLKKVGIFIKENGLTKVNPQIVLDFDQSIQLGINVIEKIV